MVRILDVYLNENHVGELRQDGAGQISFTYNEQYLENKGAQFLSHSLPLRKETFDFDEINNSDISNDKRKRKRYSAKQERHKV